MVRCGMNHETQGTGYDPGAFGHERQGRAASGRDSSSIRTSAVPSPVKPGPLSTSQFQKNSD